MFLEHPLFFAINGRNNFFMTDFFMNKTKLLVFILLLVAIIAGSLLFQFYQDQKQINQQKAELQRSLSSLENKVIELSYETREKDSSLEMSRQQIQASEEARRMIEAQWAKEESERQARLAELNRRLKEESTQRRESELAMQKLEQQIQALAQEKRAAEERLKTSDSADKTKTLIAELQERDSEMARLEAENKRLKRAQEEAARLQSQTQREIAEMTTIESRPVMDVRSPYYKRKDALFLKETIQKDPSKE
jgi:chromosome segregation ATPase